MNECTLLLDDIVGRRREAERLLKNVRRLYDRLDLENFSEVAGELRAAAALVESAEQRILIAETRLEDLFPRRKRA